MTEEYKELLFDYITGQVTPETASTDEVILQKEKINLTLMSYLPNAISYGVNGIIEGSNNYVMYGGFDDGNSSFLGYIALLDEEFNVVDVVTQYSSGTAFREICSLEVAEDNTFYGVDYEGTYTARFIMLNNFTIPDSNGNYTVKLRTSYNFNDNDFSAQIGMKSYKNPTTAHYVFIGGAESDGTVKIIELKVNVGSANEWASYNATNYDFYNNAYVDFDSNDNAYISSVSMNNNSYQIRLIYKDYTATVLSSTAIETPLNYFMYGSSPVAFVGKDKFYYTYLSLDDFKSYIKYYDSTISLIQTIDNAGVNLTSNNGNLYIAYDYSAMGHENPNPLYFQRYDGTWKPIKVLNNLGVSIREGYMFITNKYNLFKAYLINGGFSIVSNQGAIITEDYNSINYNSTPYVDGTSVIPQKARLYSNDNLVFARNDYNITASGNTYTATIEIPNVYLNGSSITPSQLISKTNTVIVNYTQAFTKNIYEKMYINFSNSISSYDEDTGRTFDTTALIKNISGLGDTYDNSKISKINLYLKNGNYYGFAPYTFTNTGRLTGYYKFTFTKSTYNDIARIEFADANNNVYFWLDTSSLGNGNYRITQYVRLADIPLGDQKVVYNNNQIQFNGNDVVYYTSI